MENISKNVPHVMGMSYLEIPTFPQLVMWEGDNWQEESMSWKESCYIHAGISSYAYRLSGPDAQALLSYMAINNVYKWKIGFSKHLVFLDPNGYIINHKLTIRDSEDTFRIFGTNTPAFIHAAIQEKNFDVKFETIETFIFQISGPLSLTVIEKVTGKDQRDLQFLETKPITIPGIDADLELSRIGMTGTLAYEIRGLVDNALDVYKIVYEAGLPYGMKRLGWRTYTVNHAEGGFPQSFCSFAPSFMIDPSLINENNEIDPAAGKQIGFSGSVEFSNYIARLRTPGQLKWMFMANFDHDFIGKEALMREKEEAKQTLVTLVWNKEDIQDVFNSLFEAGEPYKFMEFPCLGGANTGLHADSVNDLSGKRIGVSSIGHYSFYYREIISETVMDVDQAVIGNDVILQWGDSGKRIKNIRAKVARYPYLDLPRNNDYDLDTVPKGYE